MAEPRLLLLDEPSLGLAPLIVSALFETIRTIAASGVTMLLVEQNVAMALDVATRAYVLEEGRIAAERSEERRVGKEWRSRRPSNPVRARCPRACMRPCPSLRRAQP